MCWAWCSENQCWGLTQVKYSATELPPALNAGFHGFTGQWSQFTEDLTPFSKLLRRVKHTPKDVIMATVCGGQRTTFGGCFFFVPPWVPGIELRASGFLGKHLCPPTHLTGVHDYCFW